MKSAVQPTTTANAEAVPKSTKETHALDVSEKEYNRMVSQHMMYHRVMMDDIMKLSAQPGSSNASSQDQLGVVAGLGSTVDAISASNKEIMKSANQKSEQGKQNANDASKLDANMRKINSSLHSDVVQYEALMKKQTEGFSNHTPTPNPNLDAALGNSEIVVESQKYALVVFGVFAIYLLYKTAKHL